ncbi:GNAT family N-acetyltransferase [Algoriphagus algorifonticola]|uniref:GNAT family N-acetyltransferase n=1 Tax=Algoriphagus algorifonticola TaxID=2593007 RepID=UPI00119FA4A4|nr:GNAT family N-acetyltransferase [Algoriphagus algorifonticola]
MIIRKAEETDTDSIIHLLRTSLGESLLPKSLEFWRWKHLDNPFGRSPVLLAEENGELAGIRAFLKWEFTQGTKIYKCGRAVDTAVHPNHQKKGIFTQLTQSLLKQVQQEGYDLIFNTPNTKSLPGYLKMGWKKWGRLPLKIQFYISFRPSEIPKNNFEWDAVKPLIQEFEESANPTEDLIQSRLKKGYIVWRYQKCPVANYSFISDFKSYLLVYRIKEVKWGKELRVCDLFCSPNFEESEKRELNEQFRNLIKQEEIRFSSFSGLSYNSDKLDLGISPVLQRGPLVTIKPLKETLMNQPLMWNWSLGDLELF